MISDVTAFNDAEPVVKNGKYTGWKITPTLWDAINVLGKDRGVTNSELRNHIKAHGFVPPAQYFDSTVTVTLKRFVKQKKVRTYKENDTRFYMLEKI